MNWKVFAVVALICLLLGGGTAVVIGRYSSKADEPKVCIAGPGEICPSPDFAQELKNLKAMGDRLRALQQEPKIKEIIELQDTQRGMAERMQMEVNQVLQANPGHVWDGVKEKFVPAPPAPAPAATPATPPKK